MKKIYFTLLLACISLTAFAQEQNDTTYVMFDFNQNPWNYPYATEVKGWSPNYDYEVGAIYNETEFSWPLSEGSDKNVVITVYPVDLDEYDYPAYLYKTEEYGVGEKDSEGKYPMFIMLYTNPGTSMRFKAPEGYKFGKMMFYDYRSSYYTLETEEIVKAYRSGSWHDDTHKIWIPTTPKKDKYGSDCWEGDETNILFNNITNFKGVFMKIDMRLVPDGSAGINDLQATKKESSTMTTLDGRIVKSQEAASKGIYIIDGKKHIVK